MNDETEPLRKERVAELNSVVQSDDKQTERARLEKTHGQVWDTSQLSNDFIVESFSAPYVVVRRRSDNQQGSLEFQHSPRFYFNWQPYRPGKSGLLDEAHKIR